MLDQRTIALDCCIELGDVGGRPRGGGHTDRQRGKETLKWGARGGLQTERGGDRGRSKMGQRDGLCRQSRGRVEDGYIP